MAESDGCVRFRFGPWPMNSNRSRQHHYIPRCLLKNFCEDGNGQVWVGDSVRRKVYPVSPDKAFRKRDLNTSYDLSCVTIKSDNDEKLLGNLEGEVTPVVGNIVRCARYGRPPKLSPEHRVSWKHFFIAMARRTPEAQQRIAFNERHRDVFYETCARLLVLNNQVVPDKTSFYGNPRFSQLQDISLSNSSARFASGNHPILQKDAEQYSDTIGICVAVIRNPRRGFVIGSHGLTLVQSCHPNDSVIGSWLPIAHDVAIVATDLPDKESLLVLDDKRDRIIRTINAASTAQSQVIAGRSEALIRSLM